jgi:enamine deaminase RidA (YjgF/YER057c/UK114 family)
MTDARQEGGTFQTISTEAAPKPFGRYAQAIVTQAPGRIFRSSGILGMTAAGEVPEDALAQAQICFATLQALLGAAGLGPRDVIHLGAYVTDRAFMADYMRARDAFLGATATLPASTLLIVSGFTRPEFKVEVEATALLTDGKD